MITLDTVAEFAWNYGSEFFLETSEGNFVWSDPDHNGDNKIRPFDGSYKEWCKSRRIPFGRDKGKHVIRRFCGESVQILNT